MEIEEFCEKLLGVKLHPIQIDMVKSITEDTRVRISRLPPPAAVYKYL